jgi:hypothetical protein
VINLAASNTRRYEPQLKLMHECCWSFANIEHDGAVSSATNEKQNVMYLNTLLEA